MVNGILNKGCKEMEYYMIEFASKHDNYSFERSTFALDWIAENIVAEIQTGKYGNYPPIHHDECAYYDGGSKFEALVECKPQYIRMFVNGLLGNMQDDFEIHYFLRKPVYSRRVN